MYRSTVNTRLLALVAVLVTVVAISGCTAPRPPSNGSGSGSGSSGGFEVTPSDGLSLSFSAPQNPYNEDDPIILELQMENTGEAEATWGNGFVRTFGASFIIDNGGPCTGNQNPADGSLTPLSPVVTGAQQAGGQVTVVWRCDNTVDLAEGEHDTFPAGVEVQYGYGTTVTAPITLISDAEYDSSGGQVQTENSAAPVHATVKLSSPRPVPEGGATLSAPIEFHNVGDGEVVGEVSIDSISVGGSTGPDISCPQTQFELVQGSRTLTCDVTVNNAPPVQTDYTLDMTLSYTYMESLQSSITINGLPG